jgi:hypothetical protein
MLVLVSNVPWLRSARVAQVNEPCANGSNKKARFCVGISGLHVREKLERQADECGFFHPSL